MNWGWFLLRLALGLTILSLLVLSQRFWHRGVWRLTRRITRKWLRASARLFWFGAFGLVLFALVDAARLNHRHMLHFGNLLFALSGLWFSSALFAYLSVKSVRAFDRTWSWAKRAIVAKRAADDQDSRGAFAALENPSRRYLFQAATRVAGAAPFLCALYGYADERLRYQVRQVEIPLPNLPLQLDGMRIVQLSDIHRSSYMPREGVRRAVDMANELQADLAVVTGDFITGAADPLAECIGELSRLRAPLGIWGCNGNHEIYARAEAAAQRLFARPGMRLLRQESAQLTWRGAQFNLIGVDYQRQRTPQGGEVQMLPGVERLVRRDMPNILLSHNPNSFPRAAELGIELSLAGHTHGGQVRVEILDHSLSPARFITDYVAGLYQRPLYAPASTHRFDENAAASGEGRSQSSIYVNRGLGTVGAPVRLGVPPEITLIVLHRA
jgi:predicted MPP superfamily phosphohydrolase